MQISQILRQLPADLEWMVLFDLAAVRQLASDEVVRAMYFLPEDLDLDPFSHVILSSEGRLLAPQAVGPLREAETGAPTSLSGIPLSLGEQFAERLAWVPVDEADCLGLGEQLPYAPVLLHLRLAQGVGQAQAIFDQAPSQEHYELLRAVGVEYLGGDPHPKGYVAHFRNRLPVHIHTGILSHFERTTHCNQFFLQHGQIDPILEAGLLEATTRRMGWGQRQGSQAVQALAVRVVQQPEVPLSMRCQPPLPDRPFDYGDLVPLGFLLRALKTTNPEFSGPLQAHLQERRKEDLWAFHSGRLITATDSALVMLGYSDRAGAEALERFADPDGGYVPQQWRSSREQDTLTQAAKQHQMLLEEDCRHWCQADFATTCLVRAWQRQWDLENTSLSYLQTHFGERSGLYFANPYLVDWALALALAEDPTPEAALLREQLQAELLASQQPDYSFGTFDPALSTALGILSLTALGVRDRRVRMAQLRLVDWMNPQGYWPVSAPFYSSLRLDPQESPPLPYRLLLNRIPAKGDSPALKLVRSVADEYHGISLYWDQHRMIGTALAVLALAQPTDGERMDPSTPADPHPRYRCADPTEYIARCALPPYVSSARLGLVASGAHLSRQRDGAL
ncbi:hypothetical protein L1047_04405 [Synechococcus sp. Nb3U1]|uniref:hypothetical protein n=1 Tax=Synechococcus sp. Nb3U1 TaxID=1914529 RepID=UPI001F1CBEA0|nr:hypothetical protein [Synechococcus sp. Nb3U1]MCF2970437.1 hypothetical protein [Synechococcus sp. Nb3U1]